MLILFKDNSGDYPVLTCVHTDEISYDTDDETIYFCANGRCWFTRSSLIWAEQMIRTGFETGRLDLSRHFFELYEG